MQDLNGSMNLIYCQMRRRWDLVTDNFLAAAQKFPRPRLAMPRCCSAHAPSFKSHPSHATMLRSKAFMLPRGSLRRRWDLNPRGTFAPAGFRNRCLQPLSHSSNSARITLTLFCHFFKKLLSCSSQTALSSNG